jgi:hypothetical protein
MPTMVCILIGHNNGRMLNGDKLSPVENDCGQWEHVAYQCCRPRNTTAINSVYPKRGECHEALPGGNTFNWNSLNYLCF